jgi:hypothetical protein
MIGIPNFRASSPIKPSHQILFACASKTVFVRQLNRFTFEHRNKLPNNGSRDL